MILEERAPFGFIFDSGCFHSFSSENDRRRFAQNVANILQEFDRYYEKERSPDKSLSYRF
jgi:hypothetical protein